MGDRQAEQRFRQYFDGELDAAGLGELEQSLRQSPEVRKQFLGYAEVEGLLREPMIPAGFPERTSRSAGRRGSRATLKRIVGWSVLALAVALAGVLLGTVFLAEARPSTAVAVYEASDLQGFMDVAIVSGLHLQSGQSSRGLTVGQRLRPGKVVIESGSLDLQFNNGAQLQLSGPAELHVLNENEATVVSGRATVNVPRIDGHFVLNSPHFSIVDQQSSFSISVDKQASVIEVYSGSLEASLLGSRGYTYTSLTVNESQQLRASESEFGLLDARVQDKTYPSLLPWSFESIQELKIDENYARCIVADQPFLYWRFEEPGALSVKNEMSDRFNGSVTFEGAEPLIEIVDGVARFKASDVGRTLRSQDDLVNRFGGDYTIELWARPEQQLRQSILSLIPSDESQALEHSLLFEYAPESELVHPRSAFRFLYRNPSGRAGGINLFSSGGCSVASWYHLVATKGEHEISFYLNGRLVGVSRVGLYPIAESNRLYLGQLRPLHTGAQDSSTRQFCGDIDEVAIYAHRLTAEEVATHFQAGIVPPERELPEFPQIH
ncbi:LamG-like jellyroll fold domain-containing protein [Aureliella helgolandensis]|uniref:FecR protein n=1 Tax=Aureliella helgolandensis TaxID=2527968 RepID=A0A518GGF4_9BACT|nr:LamG-like jellyroll fold domain-containing protein [Aureliella helgolandensis]QDV27669.1 FecR protein [Aureliella helgolandensis]